MSADKLKKGHTYLNFFRKVIRVSVYVLAFFMTLMIIWATIDVGENIYSRIVEAESIVLPVKDMFGIFGTFMAVLIAIELFINITVYLQDDVIHVRIVMATALIAVARKIIIMDYDKMGATDLLAYSAVVIAMSVGYWLVNRCTDKVEDSCENIGYIEAEEKAMSLKPVDKENK